MNKKICFSGYYGMRNYGDDLFAITCVLGAIKYWGLSPSVISPPVEGIQRYCSIPEVLGSTYSKVNIPGSVLRGSYKLFSYLCNDIFFLAGGSTVSPSPPRLIHALSQLKSKTKLAGLGLSVEPVASKEKEEVLRRFLGNFCFLSLRDRASYEYVQELGLGSKSIMGRDLVGSLLDLYSTSVNVNSDKCVIGVAPCNYESYVSGDLGLERQRNRSLIEGVARLASEKSALVKIFSLNNHPVYGDDQLAINYERHLKDRGVDCVILKNNTLGPLRIWDEIASCKLMASVRLHGAITAYLNEVPFLLLEYHKKCTEFLNDISYEATCRVAENDPQSVYSSLNNLLDRKKPWRLDPRVYSDDSMKSFTLFPREYL